MTAREHVGDQGEISVIGGHLQRGDFPRGRSAGDGASRAQLAEPAREAADVPSTQDEALLPAQDPPGANREYDEEADDEPEPEGIV
jgi:hypothetical protein